MATEIKMPQLGESVVEGTITKWLKQEGDSVQEDELLVEVSTDKVDSEVPSSASGTIQKILVDEGETVKVGTTIAVVGEGDAGSSDGDAAAQEGSSDQHQAPAQQGQGEDGTEGGEARREKPSDDDTADQPQADASGDEEAPQPAAEGEDVAEDRGGATSEDESQPAASGGDQDGQQPAQPRGGDTSKRGIISPLVRRLADENGVSLEEIEGTGTGGRIRKQDVMRFVESGKGKPAAQPAASAQSAPAEDLAREEAPAPRPAARAEGGAREESVPWTNIRRRTAEHMAASARETARAWNAVEADWTTVVKLRETVKAGFKQREGFNLTYMAFLGRAVCETLL